MLGPDDGRVRPVAVGLDEPYVVVGALLVSEGRKTFTCTALYDTDGDRLARAEHTWIAVDPARF